MKKVKKIQLIPFEKLHQKFMKDPEFKKEHNNLEPEFVLIEATIKTRAQQSSCTISS